MIGVRDLRSQLATAVRRAGAGERIVVTVDGRAIAQLGPVESAAGGIALADLVASGSLIPPRRTDAARPGVPVPIWSGLRIDRALREVRG